MGLHVSGRVIISVTRLPGEQAFEEAWCQGKRRAPLDKNGTNGPSPGHGNRSDFRFCFFLGCVRES